MTRTSRFALALTFLAVTTLVGCSSSDGTCASDSDCDANQYCVIEEGVCDDELAPLPECESQAYSICSGDTSYWYNSCDELEGEREVCENTECIGDRCAEPTCSDATKTAMRPTSTAVAAAVAVHLVVPALEIETV